MQKRISTLIGIIIIVVAAVILFGGVFAWQYLATKSQQNSEFFASRQKTNQTQTQTAGWKTYIKTYTNSQINFEFKYPVNAEVYEDSSGGAYAADFNVFVQDGKGYWTGKNGEKESLAVDLMLYTRDTVISFGWTNGRQIPNQTAFKNKNGDVVYVTLEDKNYKDIYAGILSTFKFTK